MGDGWDHQVPSHQSGQESRPAGAVSCVVSSGAGFFPATEGQGNTWNEAFADARPR